MACLGWFLGGPTVGPLRLRGAVVGPLKKCRGCPPSSGGVSFRVVKSHFWWFGQKNDLFCGSSGFFREQPSRSSSSHAGWKRVWGWLTLLSRENSVSSICLYIIYIYGWLSLMFHFHVSICTCSTIYITTNTDVILGWGAMSATLPGQVSAEKMRALKAQTVPTEAFKKFEKKRKQAHEEIEQNRKETAPCEVRPYRLRLCSRSFSTETKLLYRWGRDEKTEEIRDDFISQPDGTTSSVTLRCIYMRAMASKTHRIS